VSNAGAATAALRIARRDALRHGARSVLVVVMIALPVLALTAADVMARTMQLSTTEKINRALGHADAEVSVLGGQVTQAPSGGGYSSDSGFATPGTTAFSTGLDRLRRSLPAGSRMIERVNGSAPAGTGKRLVPAVEITGLDLRDPMTTGLVRVTRGKAPADTTEAAVTDHLAARLHLSPGSALTVGAKRFTVVAIAHNPQAVKDDLVVTLPAAVPVKPSDTSVTFLVTSPTPITWAAVQRLNHIGVGVMSRYVVEHPPAGVPSTDASTLASRAREVGIATVAVGLAMLEVVLLAGATFAVGARRQRRDLALVAAAGGDERDIRRVVLAGGFVLGVVGAAIGVGCGVVVGKAAVPLAAQLADRDPGHFDLRLLEIALIALLGVGTGVAAAILPARTAARDDVVAALTGRRGVVATARRVPLAGVAMIVLGGIAAAYAAHPPARFTMVLAGAVVAEIGVVICAPAVVGAAGRAARLLPLPMRLAVRDASRHRGRTGPAVAAVLAAVAGSVAVSAWVTSQVAYDRESYRPQLRVGQSALQVYPDDTIAAPTRAELAAVVTRDLPVTDMTPMSTTSCFDARRCTGVSLRPAPKCQTGPTACAVDLGSGGIAVGDSTVLDALLGRHDRGAAAARDKGARGVLSPG
jgi:putative ABC transport system permease protein